MLDLHIQRKLSVGYDEAAKLVADDGTGRRQPGQPRRQARGAGAGAVRLWQAEDHPRILARGEPRAPLRLEDELRLGLVDQRREQGRRQATRPSPSPIRRSPGATVHPPTVTWR